MKHKKTQSPRVARGPKRTFLYVCVGFVALATAYFFFGLSQSVAIAKQERLQFVVYGEQTKVYSLGMRDGIHYVISYPAQYKIEVPDGYGNYRVGALGRLVYTEKKPELLIRTMSVASHTMLTHYFYRPTKTIWYESSTKESADLPSVYEIFTLESNATLYDRFYIWQALTRVRKGDVIPIPTADARETSPGGDKLLSNRKLQKQLEAYLFQEEYRAEELNVQIIYNLSYKTADRIGSIIEGAGISVVDISQTRKIEGEKGRCRLVAANAQVMQSHTAVDIARFFNCVLMTGDVDHSDLQLILGDQEEEWLIN
jgi:hypothetical protein